MAQNGTVRATSVQCQPQVQWVNIERVDCGSAGHKQNFEQPKADMKLFNLVKRNFRTAGSRAGPAKIIRMTPPLTRRLRPKPGRARQRAGL